MKYSFMGQCVAVAAFLPLTSLNEPLADEGAEGDALESEIVDQLVDPDAPSENDLGFAILMKRLPEFMATLPPNLHHITHCYFWLGQTQTEIAAALGVTQSAIAHALRRVTRLGREFFGITEH